MTITWHTDRVHQGQSVVMCLTNGRLVTGVIEGVHPCAYVIRETTGHLAGRLIGYNAGDVLEVREATP